MRYISHILDIDVDDIVAKIMKLKTLWVSRHNEFIFYTLGPCAYMDGIKPDYKLGKDIVNPILKKEFGDLYKKISEYLETGIGENVYLNDDLAYPSFHIIESNEYALHNGGKWHVDCPQLAVGHEDKDQITFTVAIKLPTGGAGIDYSEDEGRTIQYLPYQEKQIIVHSGSTLHRIAPIKQNIQGEYRITMQGHIIRINGKLNMFW